MADETILPSVPVIERGVLGAGIIDPRALALICEQCDLADFDSNKHKILFEALSSGGATDCVLFAEYLRKAGKLAEIGGDSFIAELVENPPTIQNLPAHIAELKSMAIRRKIVQAAQEMHTSAQSEESPDEIVGKSLETLSTIRRTWEQWKINELSPRRFFETAPKAFEYIIPGFLPKGIIGFLYGEGGVYKSLASLWLVIQLAIYEFDNSGLWLNRFMIDSMKRSIFFSAEDVEIDLHHRTINILSWIHKNRPDIPIETLQEAVCQNSLIMSREQWKKDGELFLVDSDGCPTNKINSVIQAVKNFGADLVILETYSRIANVDEIDNRTAARVVGALEEIRDQTGATVVCNAHSSKASRNGKGDTHGQNGLRGAGALADNSRWGLWFRAEKRGENGLDRIKIEHAKAFRGKRAEPFTLEISYPNFTVVEEAAPKGSKAVKYDSVRKLIKTKLIWSHSDLSKAIIETTGESLSTSKRRINEAVELGELSKNVDGTYTSTLFAE